MISFLRRVAQFRLWVMWVAAVAVVGWYWLTDPDGGHETVARLQWLAWLVVAGGPAYLLRRALIDGARSREAYRSALSHPIGAGLVFLGLCLLTGLLFLAFSSQARAGELPGGAKLYISVLKSEQTRLWPGHPAPAVLAALVEQETCPSLSSAKCWNPHTELITQREYGFGLGQKTVAFNPDGRERFNGWRESRAEHGDELAGWTWDRRYDARLQLRALVLDNRDCYRRITRLVPPGEDALALCDAAYNGGFCGMLSDRRLCASAPGCDADRWFGHVERHSAKSRVKWRGYGMSAYEINRAHVRGVMVTRRARYVAWM